MKENYYLDDGTYSASQIVIIMVKRYLEGLGKDIYVSLLADLKEPVESNEFRLKLKVHTFVYLVSLAAEECLLAMPVLGRAEQTSDSMRALLRPG